MMPPSRPPIPIFNRMPVLSTAMALGRNSLHQDKDEPDLRAPIVSVSWLPAVSIRRVTLQRSSPASDAGAWGCGGGAGSRGSITMAFSH